MFGVAELQQDFHQDYQLTPESPYKLANTTHHIEDP
jgi:hypothetical protein